eukprot:c8711_g1_i1.p1 GENE.c8711_g1_i1~~c8711_g1_i1.p1  ORF type:complete len:692 (-),score=151.09 c8711_g1_i1:339-2414(-)
MLILTCPVQFHVGRRFYVNAWKALKHGHTNMDVLVVLGTSAAFLYSVIVMIGEAVSSKFEQHTFFETSAMLITFIIAGKYVESFAKRKTSAALLKLVNLQPPTAVLIVKDSDGHVISEREVDVATIRVGDIVSIKTGSRVPVDGSLIHGSCALDESMMTGESLPVPKVVGSGVIGGTIVASGVAHVLVERIGDDTTLAQIVRLVEEAQSSKAQEMADRISAVFVPIVVALSVITFVVWLAIGYPGIVMVEAKPIVHAFIFGVSVLVISCPCTLGLATPTAVVAGTGRAASLGVLIKGAAILQRAEKVRAIVFDKTGTLSCGRFEVTQVIRPKLQPPFDDKTIFELVAGAEAGSNHPLAVAVVRYVQQTHKITKLPSCNDFEVVEGLGICCRIRDHSVIVGNRELFRQNSVDIDHAVDDEAVILESQACTVIFVGIDKRFCCAFAISDVIRPEASETIQRLEQMGIETWMITGDNLGTATAVAAIVGVRHVLAETRPKDKADQIRNLQHRFKGKGLVAMVGDGINDSPALVAADVGLAIGSGTDIAMESADIVLMKSNLWDVVVAIDLCRVIFRRIRLNFVWGFGYNILAIPIAAGLIYPFTDVMLQPHWAGAAMAASSVCVVTSSMLLRWYVPPKMSSPRSRAVLMTRVPVVRSRCKCDGECMCSKLLTGDGMKDLELSVACKCGDVCSCR